MGIIGKTHGVRSERAPNVIASQIKPQSGWFLRSLSAERVVVTAGLVFVVFAAGCSISSEKVLFASRFEFCSASVFELVASVFAFTFALVLFCAGVGLGVGV